MYITPQRSPLIWAFFFILVSSGCRVDFEATSVVREDGSLERTSVLRAKDDNDKEEILSRYELPAGGEWKEERSVGGELTASVYQSSRVVLPGQFPASDYKRLTENKDKAAANTFSVETKDIWVAKTFIYREEFKDVVDRGRISGILNSVFEKGLAEFRQSIAAGVPDVVQADRMTDLVRGKYKPLIDKMAKELTERGSASPELEAVMEELQREFTSEKVFELLAQDAQAFSTPENRALIDQAFDAAETKLSSEIEPVRESIFGIHGLAVLQNYNFEVRVTMPGDILKSNADKVDDGTLIWEFDSGEMEQTLEASSRKVYPLRAGLALAAILILIIITRSRFMRNSKLPVLILAVVLSGASAVRAEDTAKPFKPTQIDVGTEFSHFQYEEPGFMEDKGYLYGVFGNISHRISENQPIKSFADIFGNGNTLNAYELDGRFSFGYVDYESTNTGTLDDIRDYIIELRGTAGYDIPLCSSFTLTPYIGLGYRYLNDDSAGERTSTGAAGYERESNYFYLPLGLNGVADLGSGWTVGLRGEFDIFLYGQQKSHLSDAIAGLGDVTNDQEDGYGLRASLKVMKETEAANFFIEPFVRYWHIDDSEISAVTYQGVLVGFGLEPENKSTEVGFRAGINF